MVGGYNEMAIAFMHPPHARIFIMMNLKEIEQEAMRLSDEDREILAVELLRSISTGATDDIEQAWIAEAHQRLDDLARDPSQAIDAETMHDELKKEFGWS